MKVSLNSLLLSLGLIIPFTKSFKLTDRIVGGVTVKIEDFPYQVSVRVYDQHSCGGSIIDEYTILTAASCVDGMGNSELGIRYGNTYQPLGLYIEVSQIRQHPYFNPETIHNDVAILKLNSGIRFSPKAQPIPLNNIEIPPGTGALVSGWGVLKEGTDEISGNLQALDVHVISKTECNLSYSGKITVGMLCAQKVGSGVCKGDAGGPLVAGGTLIGIVSWGYGCARPQYSNVYTKVHYYYDWIRRNSF